MLTPSIQREESGDTTAPIVVMPSPPTLFQCGGLHSALQGLAQFGKRADERNPPLHRALCRIDAQTGTYRSRVVSNSWFLFPSSTSRTQRWTVVALLG